MQDILCTHYLVRVAPDPDQLTGLESGRCLKCGARVLRIHGAWSDAEDVTNWTSGPPEDAYPVADWPQFED